MAGESDITNNGTTDAPDTNAIQSADADYEAQADAVLAKIMDGGDASKETSSGPGRDASGRFAKSEATTEKKPEAKSEQASEPALPEGVKPDDYRKALKALQFDNVPQKYLDTLSPTELVEWGLKRAKNHADVSRLQTDLANAKKSTPAKPQTEAKAEPEPAMDWGKLTEPLANKFNEELGVDMTEPLQAFGKQIAELVQKANEEKLKGQNSLLENIQAQFRHQQQESARSKLTEKFNLDDADRWQKVLEHRESDKNDYASEQEAIEAACRHEFADEIIASYEAKLKEQHKLRDKGQSTTQHGKTPPKSMTQDEVEDQILDAIMSGDRERASRLGRRSNNSSLELMTSN